MTGVQTCLFRSWFRHIGRMVSLDEVQIPQEQELDVKSAVVAEIMCLPGKLKEVVLLYYYEDMNLSEIAEALNVSITTVHRRLEKARVQLKDMLEGGDVLEA